MENTRTFLAPPYNTTTTSSLILATLSVDHDFTANSIDELSLLPAHCPSTGTQYPILFFSSWYCSYKYFLIASSFFEATGLFTYSLQRYSNKTASLATASLFCSCLQKCLQKTCLKSLCAFLICTLYSFLNPLSKVFFPLLTFLKSSVISTMTKTSICHYWWVLRFFKHFNDLI